MKTIIATITLAGGLALGACAVNPQGNNSGASSPPPSTATAAGTGEAKGHAPEPEITLAEFDKIQKGMTYEQVVQIVGVNGEVSSSYEASDPKWSSKSYTFKGTDVFSSAMVTFTGGVVDMKMQSGLD